MGYGSKRLLKQIVLILLLIISLISLFSALTARYGGLGNLLNPLFWFAITFIVNKFWKVDPPRVEAPRNIDHGSAQWANAEEFARINQPDKTNPRGLYLGDAFIRTKPGHLITVAGSGQGKGTCLIIPSLLLAPSGSYIVTDPKGENACITARSHRDFGQRVFILDPWDEQQRMGAKHGIPASGFNPFDFLKMDMDELRDNCEQIAALLVPDRPGDKDPYWNDRARALIKVMMMHIVTGRPAEEHNFFTLYKMLRLSGKPWVVLMLEMKDNQAMDGLVSIAAEEFLGMDDAGTALGGIRSSAQNATTIFESPQLRRSLEKSDLNPYDLTNGNCTVYIVIPERFLETHGTWLRLVIGLCMKACNARPKERVYFLLDEFAIMGKMRDIQKGYAFARGQNIILWFFAQSLSQIKELYGEDGMNTFLSNAAVIQAFGVKDQFTKEYISKMLGDATYVKKVDSFGTSSSAQGGGSSSSTSYQSYGRPLLTPDEVETERGMITIAEGLRFVINRQHYYKNRFTGVPATAQWLNAEQKKAIKSGQLPVDETMNYFLEKADPAPRVYA